MKFFKRFRFYFKRKNLIFTLLFGLLFYVVTRSQRIYADNDKFPRLSDFRRRVSTSAQLLEALNCVQPGEIIHLANGTYSDAFVITRSGTKEDSIIMKGQPSTIIENPNRDPQNLEIGFGLHLKASYWVLKGFTVQNSQKGIIIDGGNFNILSNLTVVRTEDEAIHFRFGSNNNTVTGCFINDTGRGRPGYGEGVYVGQDNAKWANGVADRCDGNEILGNTFGEAIRSECIDIKEGTCCGRIAGNNFDGRGQTGKLFDDSWMDIKGDRYLIEDNVGYWSIKDGFEVSDHLPPGKGPSGCGNVYQRNRCVFQEENKHGYCLRFRNQGNCTTIVLDGNVVVNGRGVYKNRPTLPPNLNNSKSNPIKPTLPNNVTLPIVPPVSKDSDITTTSFPKSSSENNSTVLSISNITKIS